MYIREIFGIQWSMDRIYYFMVAKEKSRGVELSIFRKEIGPYEVYYLQVPKTAENDKFVSLKAYMDKGIARIRAQCEGTGVLPFTEGIADNTWTVWDREFELWLRTGGREFQWQKIWDLPMYQEYKEVHNLIFLLQKIPTGRLPAQLIILGEAPGLTDILEGLARHMKQVAIYAWNPPREFENIRHAMLEEYGLCTEWKKSLQPVSVEPALVLDYSGKEKIYVWDIVPDSVWIDMTSMETRRHALEDRETGIHYFSLKSIWRTEIQQTLDTIRKIQYNVGVKLSGKVDL